MPLAKYGSLFDLIEDAIENQSSNNNSKGWPFPELEALRIFEKICESQNCKTKKIKSKLQKEIKLAILKKATLMEKEGFKKYYEKTGKNRALSVNKKE